MAGVDRNEIAVGFESDHGECGEAIVLGGAGEIDVDAFGERSESDVVDGHQPDGGVDPGGDHPGADTLAGDIGDGRQPGSHHR